jgi:hypothetical protein
MASVKENPQNIIQNTPSLAILSDFLLSAKSIQILSRSLTEMNRVRDEALTESSLLGRLATW